MNVLIACECSGIIRTEFRLRGHNTYSCDLKPAEDSSDAPGVAMQVVPAQEIRRRR